MRQGCIRSLTTVLGGSVLKILVLIPLLQLEGLIVLEVGVSAQLKGDAKLWIERMPDVCQLRVFFFCCHPLEFLQVRLVIILSIKRLPGSSLPTQHCHKKIQKKGRNRVPSTRPPRLGKRPQADCLHFADVALRMSSRLSTSASTSMTYSEVWCLNHTAQMSECIWTL